MVWDQSCEAALEPVEDAITALSQPWPGRGAEAQRQAAISEAAAAQL